MLLTVRICLMKIILPVIFLITVFLFTSCEAFFTNNWFQSAAVYDNISAEEAIASGDTSIMQELFDQVVEDAASATGSEAAELYLQAADLALGISGLSDPSVLLGAPDLLSGGDGGTGDIFAVLTDSDLDLEALENVGDMIDNAEAADPGSVTSEMWVFAAAGNGAAVANDAEAAGQSVEDYLGDDPMANPDANAAVQSLVNALDVLPDDIATQLTDNQADLEADGIIFP